MRADRLLSMMMLLQTRGLLTARQLAEELEVSERTIYRDIEALSVAGIPVITESGTGGGVMLMDDYRTSLTGLTEAELQALFMMRIPAALSDLGLDNDVRQAMRKFSASLATPRQRTEEWIKQRVLLDMQEWFHQDEPLPWLRPLYRAVCENRRVLVRLALSFGGEMTGMVEPYGLVSKAGVWHLVYARRGQMIITEAASVISVQLMDDCFERQTDFDLAVFWEDWCRLYEANRVVYPVVVWASPGLWSTLRIRFGDEVFDTPNQRQDQRGWLNLVLNFDGLEAARRYILSCGCAIEVVEPLPLRLSVEDFAHQIVTLYRGVCP